MLIYNGYIVIIAKLITLYNLNYICSPCFLSCYSHTHTHTPREKKYIYIYVYHRGEVPLHTKKAFGVGVEV